MFVRAVRLQPSALQTLCASHSIRRCSRLGLWVGATLAACAAVVLIPVGDLRLLADETPIAAIEHPEPVDFQREILPILRKKCLACHNGTTAESDLVLETPEAIRKGGLSGPAMVPGSPDESHLLALAAYREDPVMPPEDNEADAERMTSEELGLLKLWIEQGARGSVTGSDEPIDWQPLPAGVNPVFAAAQSPDGRMVVLGRANQASVYDVLLGQYVEILIDPSLADLPVANGQPIAHLDLVQSLAFSHDGQWIASGGYRTLKLWRRTAAVEQAAQLDLPPLVAAAQHAGAAHYLADESGRIVAVDSKGAAIAGVSGVEGHSIRSIAVSPDGQRLAISGADNSLRIANIGGEAAAAHPQPSPVQQVIWIDGRLVAGACADQKVRFWSVDEAGILGEPCELEGHAGAVTSIALCGLNRLASATADGNVRLWDIESGRMLRELNHGGAIGGLAASRAGDRLVTFGADTLTKLWNVESGEQIAELAVDLHLQWQHQQRELAQRISQRHVDNLNQDIEAAKKRIEEEELNLKKDQEAREQARAEVDKATAPADEAAQQKEQAQQALDAAKLKLADAEKAAAEAADDATKQSAAAQLEAVKKEIADAEAALKAKTEEAEKAAKQLAEHRQTLEAAERSVVISEQAVADAKSAAEQLTPRQQQASEQFAARQQETKQAESRLQEERHSAHAAVVSDDGKLIVSVDGQGRTALWRAADGTPIQIETLSAGDVRSLAFARDRSAVVVTSDGKLFTIDSTPHWQLARTVGAPDNTSSLSDRVTALDFSPDNQFVAIGGGQPSRGGELKIYRVEDGELVREFVDAHSDTIFGLAFSPDGRQLASCGADRFMKVFDVASGELVRTFEGHTHHVLSVGWRADGRVLATGGADAVVKIWNAADGSQVRTIQGFGKEVTSVEFAGADDHFYAACGDRNLYRCNMEGERKSIGSGQDFLYVVSTNLLGKSVAFGGHDSIVRVVDDSGTSLGEAKPQ